ncbi:MAG: MBOAT family O-acyltransferase, partial [Candidatus Binatia bacterium]
LGLEPVPVPDLRLPLGISFFTFHTVSYLVDVSRGVVPAVRQPSEFALYSALFPHLVAGPIVRYREIADRLRSRIAGLAEIGDGCGRFVVGLAKKVLVADRVGEAADGIFALGAGDLSAVLAWSGAALYALQIYFDFSGYSDMAIGLGRMLGFEFPENFDRPYASASIREFWRRWHMTLSRWFRDYLFIPLGGSRGSTLATARNLLIVFFLCGLWHGAAWTFVAWGLFHGFFLAAERVGEALVDWRPPRLVARVYTLAVVLVGWVFFRADDLARAGDFLRAMAGFGTATDGSFALASFVSPSGAIAALVGTAIVLAPASVWTIRLRDPRLERAAAAAAIAILLVASFAEIVAVSSRPFLYFRF